MKWPRFKLRTLLVLAVAIGVALAFVARGLHWVHERDALVLLVFSDNGPSMELTTLGSDEPPKAMPLLWRLLGARPLAEITIGPAAKEELFQRFVAAFPEADVHRGDISVLQVSGGQVAH